MLLSELTKLAVAVADVGQFTEIWLLVYNLTSQYWCRIR